MHEFAVGTPVLLTIDHISNGEAITVTSMQYELKDAHGTVLSALASVPGFTTGTTQTNITINGSLNASTAKLDIRELNVYLTTAGGVYTQTLYYKLVGEQTKLTIMTDSFMTFPETILFRAKLSDKLDYFDELPDHLKCVALSNAFEAIVKLKFINPAYIGSTSYSCPYEGVYINTYTDSQFAALPASMKAALQRAQLLEANALVEYSPIREKIKQGIISETIGESSMFFKQNLNSVSGKYPGLSDASYFHLKEFLWKNATSSQSMRIGRA